MEKEKWSKVPYASAIGSLMFAMMCTRPISALLLVWLADINPTQAQHFKVVKRIMRYLKGTADYSFCYQGYDLHLRGYTDADWGGDLDERKSTYGFIFLLSNDAISWSSKKQPCTTLSIMKAEFMAFSSAVQEAVWLKRFLDHLGVIATSIDLVLVNCDSQAAIAFTKDPKFHCKTKHIDTKYNFVKDMVTRKEVNMKYISIRDMIADPLTKPILRDVFIEHTRSQGLSIC